MTKQEREQFLREKLQTMQIYERDLRAAGKRYIAGVDEVGRGPLAGPVVAACVIPVSYTHLDVYKRQRQHRSCERRRRRASCRFR